MKVLVVRFSSIGDIVLTSPVVRCLKTRLKPEIHYLTKAEYLPVLEANPYIDRIWTIKKDIPEVLPALRQEKYDFIVDLHHNLRTFRLRHSLNLPVGKFPKLNLEKWLLTQFKIKSLPDLHIVDRYFEAVKPLEVKNDGKGLDYFIPEAEEIEPGKIHHGANPGNYTAIAIGGKFYTKKMPSEMIGELCKKITQPVIVLGGPEDAGIGEGIATAAGYHVVSACGKLSINGSASIIRQAQKVISHDTGMMHIAAAFQKPIISIWGNTVPEFGMSPYYGNGENRNLAVEVDSLNCRPCSKLGYQKCPKGHFKCMKDINLGEILEKLEQA